MRSLIIAAGAAATLAGCSGGSAPVLSSFESERDRIRASLSNDITCTEDNMVQVGGGGEKMRAYRCSLFSATADGSIGFEILGVGLQEETGAGPTRTIYSIFLATAPEAAPFRPDFNKLVAHYGMTSEKLAACEATGSSLHEGQGFKADCVVDPNTTPLGLYIWVEKV
jgi:hypothetical protein